MWHRAGVILVPGDPLVLITTGIQHCTSSSKCLCLGSVCVCVCPALFHFVWCFAVRGNELAQLGHYQAAVDMFSEAIKLHDSDHRWDLEWCMEQKCVHYEAIERRSIYCASIRHVHRLSSFCVLAYWTSVALLFFQYDFLSLTITCVCVCVCALSVFQLLRQSVILLWPSCTISQVRPCAVVIFLLFTSIVIESMLFSPITCVLTCPWETWEAWPGSFCVLFSAERDANKAIDLSPEWPKGYFRRARALAGQRVSWSVFLLPLYQLVCLLTGPQFCSIYLCT